MRQFYIFFDLSHQMTNDYLLISFFTHFYLFLCVANMKCCAHQISSKQKQFCVHVQQIIVNPGKLSEITQTISSHIMAYISKL